MKKVHVIYILSMGSSGSTMLGYMLGASQKIENVGEINALTHHQKKRMNIDEICSCGARETDCPYWKEVLKEDYKIYSHPPLLTQLKIMTRIILGISFKQSGIKNSADYRLFRKLLGLFGQNNDELDTILDTSKNLWRLIYLMQCDDIDLKVLYLRRDIYGNVSSFMKYEKSFWKSLIKYVGRNYFMKRFLDNNNVKQLHVNYFNYCNDTNNEMKRIGNFLGIDQSGYEDKMKSRDYHVSTGNMKMREKFREGSTSIKYDSSWKERLNWWENLVLRLFEKPAI